LTVAVGWRRSSAYTVCGYGVTRYIVSPITSGAASWPLSLPVGKLNASFSVPTLPALIWSSGLKRVPCVSWATVGQSPDGVDALAAGEDALLDAGGAASASEAQSASAATQHAAKVRRHPSRFTVSSCLENR
jgi:thiazole synthase ThiGH ThiG subunit